MSGRDVLVAAGKVALGGGAFIAGEMIGSVAAGRFGLPPPDMPAGADPGALLALVAIGSLILSAILGVLARRLAGGFLARWLILAAFTWATFGVGTVLEASIFTTFAAASPYTVVMYLFFSLAGGAAVAWLFAPPERGESFGARVRAFFAPRSVGQWAWRFLAALLAFPVAYLLFGAMVAPVVTDYYRQQAAGLTLPGMDQILPMALLRSLLFLLACLPVLIAWQGGRFSLWLALGGALFLTVGGVGLLEAYWFPTVIRVAHGAEILADSLAHAGALVWLLVPAGWSVRETASSVTLSPA